MQTLQVLPAWNLEFRIVTVGRQRRPRMGWRESITRARAPTSGVEPVRARTSTRQHDTSAYAYGKSRAPNPLLTQQRTAQHNNCKQHQKYNQRYRHSIVFHKRIFKKVSAATASLICGSSKSFKLVEEVIRNIIQSNQRN